MAKFKCSFCNREFVRETTLASHSCPKKLYHTDKDEKYTRDFHHLYLIEELMQFDEYKEVSY